MAKYVIWKTNKFVVTQQAYRKCHCEKWMYVVRGNGFGCVDSKGVDNLPIITVNNRFFLSIYFQIFINIKV